MSINFDAQDDLKHFCFLKITQLPWHLSIIGSVPEKKLKISDYLSKKLLKLIYESETIYGQFEWTIKRVNTGMRLANPGYFEYNSFNKNLWNSWFNSNLSEVVVLLVRSTFKITPHNLPISIQDGCHYLKKKKPKNPKASGGDILFFRPVSYSVTNPCMHSSYILKGNFSKLCLFPCYFIKNPVLILHFDQIISECVIALFTLKYFFNMIFCQKQPLIVIKMGSVVIVIFPIIIS